ncbi:MAG: S8 family serine peptidase [Nanohaloarchaea archaeon]|nr:S8 family serine peptidase [Candidatus Nanohaloarchaea archaeon]
MKIKVYCLVSVIVMALVILSGITGAIGIDKISAKIMPSDRWVEVAPQAIDSSPGRVIAQTTSDIDKLIFRLKGCKILHELQDETVLRCPPGVALGLKDVRDDRIFNIVDLEADIQIGADSVWAQGIFGTGVNVAVLDTGVDIDHPELDGSIISCETLVLGTTCDDDHGHGTHVSGIITADGVDADAKGVAPDAGIYMYKVCGADGSCYESDMIAAMEAAVLTDAKVMSISIGGGNFAGDNCDSDPLAAKVNWVVSHGITVVVASGNDRFYVSSPACASGAIAVGAVDKSDSLAYFSNFGPSLDIVAPGVNIYSSLIDGYASWSGTSMSTPHVSGVVALMLDANPGLTIDDIKTALYETADPIDSASICYGVVGRRGANYWIGTVPCTSDNYGAGLVDAYGAINYFIPSEPVCGNDVVNPEYEVCDGTDLAYATCMTQGFDAGDLSCSSDCLAFDTSNCFNYVCGNGIIEGAEECDSLNLGGATCVTQGFDVGDLFCLSDCTFDTSNCIQTEPEPSCDSCLKGVCDGRCHPWREDATCLDCSF